MFDKVAAAGSTLDWITPLVTFVQDFRNRPSIGYSVPVDGGWSAYAISDLLKDHGIKHWGLTIVKETILFRLRVPQAAYAQYLFERNGIAYYGGVNTAATSGRNWGRHAKGARPVMSNSGGAPKARLGDLLNDSLRDIDRIIDKLPGA